MRQQNDTYLASCARTIAQNADVTIINLMESPPALRSADDGRSGFK